MTNKKRQEIIDYLEEGDKFADILIRELDKPNLTCYEKRTYSSLLDAMNGATELYCAMTDWPDNVDFRIVDQEVNDEDEIILQRGPLTINAVNQVNNYLKDLPLNSDQNNQLVQLMVKLLVDTEHKNFIQGFKVCLDALKYGGSKGVEEAVLKVTRNKNSLCNDSNAQNPLLVNISINDKWLNDNKDKIIADLKEYYEGSLDICGTDDEINTIPAKELYEKAMVDILSCRTEIEEFYQEKNYWGNETEGHKPNFKILPGGKE